MKNNLLPVFLLIQLLLQWRIKGQQVYVNNKQLACEVNSTNTLGFVCNSPSSSCLSYLTFRSNSIYNSPATIGYALNADPIEIAKINNVTDIGSLPSNTLLLIPINCSCFSSSYYQHNASYVLKTTLDTYFSIANLTYQGLTTCQALMAQNPYYFRSLLVGMQISVPLRCACPTTNQTAAGIKYLVSYLIASGNDINSIAAAFGGVDKQTILDANEIADDTIIFPFTPLLIPLKSMPTKIDVTAFLPSPPPPIPPPPPPAAQVEDGGESSKKWVIVGVGVGAAALILIVFVLLVICCRRQRMKSKPDQSVVKKMKIDEDERSMAYSPIMSDSKSWSISAEGIRQATGGGSSALAVYKLEELQKATDFFSEENRIKGSVFLGRFDGDLAAVKVVNGEVSTTEINILQKLNHSHIIRLSGFCLHEANAYLVYEYAENGSLTDLLHKPLLDSTKMNWKHRIQIAYDVADALNYLHNYSKPTCIHKNLKSSNILLDNNLRAKITNFGLSRSIAVENDQSQAMQITRHVVGTHGYMAPEYIENGLITPQLDVFAFGVVILELLSGREALDLTAKTVGGEEKEEESCLLYVRITKVLGGENVREKLQEFIDPSLEKGEYPLEIVHSLAQLAMNCVAHNPNSRPSMSDAQIILSKILSSSLDWDPLDQSGSSEY
ncbi:protein LYK5 [Impatiens glandulifera]|uniref:protein LYK5 n=1 Tax=Impatiens glandulifera TaxID=253017 RepID=UPI001FB07650|nr:protein LYK5 [Impatiens glandulifera]